MLFTVFNYLPILEEEPLHKKSELCKKVAEDSEDDGGGDTEDESEDGGAMLDFQNPLQFITYLSGQHGYWQHPRHFQDPLTEISTPPPRS